VYSARPRYCRENPGNAYQIQGWEGAKFDIERCPGTSYEKPVLCLSSGGIGSLVLQAHLKVHGYTPYSLFIDYGQAACAAEGAAAQRIAEFYGGKFFTEAVKLDVWRELPFPKGLPLRDFVFFSVAASYCEALTIPRIGIASDGKDQKFVLPKRFEILAPLTGKSKLNVARLGEKYDAPFELSWSCQQAGAAPCGACAKCTERNAVLARVAKRGSARSKAAG